MSFWRPKVTSFPDGTVKLNKIGRKRRLKILIAEPAGKPASGVPLLSKFGNLSIREILVVTSAYARTFARTDSGGGRGESQDNPTGV